jgi:endonuclease YncB( thermonuclease family)
MFEKLSVGVLSAGFAICVVAGAQAAEGGVTVLDGDSLLVGGQNFRLYGIDAPEKGQSCVINGNEFDCGMVAGTALMDLTAGSQVRCEEISVQAVAQGHDDRLETEHLALCFADGYDLSEGMVYTGWALALPELKPNYLSFERHAREKRHGLWKGSFAEPRSWRLEQEGKSGAR